MNVEIYSVPLTAVKDLTYNFTLEATSFGEVCKPFLGQTNKAVPQSEWLTEVNFLSRRCGKLTVT